MINVWMSQYHQNCSNTSRKIWNGISSVGTVQGMYMLQTSNMQWIQVCKKRDEPLRRQKHKVDEVVTLICGFLGNDDANAPFIKARYHSYTCNNSCNDGVKLKKGLVDLLMNGYMNTLIIAQSVLSQSMVLCDIQQMLHEYLNILQVPS